MSPVSPAGLRKRCARLLPALVVGGLCLALTACGGSGAPEVMKGSAGAARDMADAKAMEPPAPPRLPGAPAAGDPKREKAPDAAKANRESYATVEENRFRSPHVAPLSTFSADVNTASYGNVRRFLSGGALPPRDAVLLAELVNAFSYRYPNPAGDAPVSVTLDLAACPWKDQHLLARIGVRARSFDPGESPGRNLVFLVDVSGSMGWSDSRLPLVKKSLELLVNQLTPRDRVSIVTYAGDAGLKLPPTPGDRREAILGVVRSLTAGGGTNGSGGIKLAYEVARGSFLNGGVNRVILCTDGDFNLGQTSPSDLDQLIERERLSQVFLTVLGFGVENLKDDTLRRLANKGNGHYAYIDSLDEARKVFVEQGAALTVVAKDVKLQVEFNPRRVAAYRLIGYENRLLAAEDFRDDAKDAGDMGSGHTVTALYEIVPVGVKIDLPGVDPLKYQAPKEPAGPGDEWLTVKTRYKSPTGDVSKELPPAVLAADAVKPMHEDFAFASAVAEWGLLLRESPYRGSANYASVLKRAEAASTYDPYGHRSEFLKLLRKTIELTGKKD